MTAWKSDGRTTPWRRWAAAGLLAIVSLAVHTNAPLGQTADDVQPPVPVAGSPAEPVTVTPDATEPTPPAPAETPMPEAPATPAETPAPVPTEPPAPAPSEVPAPAAQPAPAAETSAPAPAPTGVSLVNAATSDEQPSVEIHVNNQDLSTTLELLSRSCQVNIIASKSANGKVTADLYGVTLDQALDAICRANSLKWVREGDFIYIHTAEELTALQEDDSRLQTEIFVLNYLTSEEAQKIIAPALSKKSVVSITTESEVGIPSSAEEAGGNNLGLPDTIVVRDFPENLDMVRTILAKMDRRPRQVLVEATLLSVTLNDSNDLGVDFNALAGVDFRDLSTTNIPVTDTTIVPNDSTTTAAVNGQQTSWGQIRTQGFATAGDGLNIGVITNNVSFFVHALESVTDTTVLSNPKVLALNKQRAEVIVGDRLPYQTTTVTETTAVQTVEFLDTGTQLVFRPFISDDGYVRMEIHPKVSTGTFVNNLPREQTTEVTCNVLVKGGNTIVIGGLFDETTSIGHSQIPGLGSIPLAGWLFRNRNESTVRREIIVLLTPHVIEEDEAYALGKAALDDAHRRCFGLREGFVFYSRERLTAGYVQEADKCWRRYEKSGCWFDRLGAWWNTQLALNVAPNDLKALRLKDKLLGNPEMTTQADHGWTLWDSVGDRLQAIEARAAAAEKTETVAPPAETPPPVSDEAKEVSHD